MKNKSFFVWVQYLTFVFFLFAALMVFDSCSSHRNKTTVIVQDITESVYASGIVKAVSQYEVFATTNGVLKNILVKEGDTINEDTPLFIIDNKISSISSENARLAMELSKEKTSAGSNTLREFEVRRNLARDKMENDSILLSRQKNLWAQQVGSKLDLERRELAYKASLAEYRSIEMQFSQAKLELLKVYEQSVNTLKISEKQQSDFTVRSIIKGKVYSILKEEGELVNLQTPVAIVGAADQFEIELQVDEYDITKLKSGQRVFVSMDSYKDEIFEGQIIKIEPYLNQRTKTFKVMASFLKAPPSLFPNLTVEANVLIQKKEKVLTIPASYLIGNNKVLVGPSDTVIVKTGVSNMQWVEITEGLDSGREIYLPGQ
ncbi:MAG TPA: efflux RND transporter periplasmic adaptor subunit [Bacteroidia bacterium]|nr:efflux RND transporter periplasmic adaptor subunit [Bacteroidia bacterium]